MRAVCIVGPLFVFCDKPTGSQDFPWRGARRYVDTMAHEYKNRYFFPLINFAYFFLDKTDSHLGRKVKSINFQPAKRYVCFGRKFPPKTEKMRELFKV